MSALAVALLLAAIALLIPALVLCAEVAASGLPPRRHAHAPSGPRPRVDVLVPAHDEAAVIEATVAALLRQLAPGDRVIVVADNCRDDTAALALRAGACVLERRHPERFGKGHALAAGVEFTRADPPSVVLVVDADTRPGAGLVATLATLAHATGRPVQAAYTLEPPRSAWLGARLSAFAFRLRNRVRPRGLARLGLPCGLTGSGMAIPWERLRTATLAHGRTAEDLALGVDLALAGAPPLFCDDVEVVGRLPERSDDAFAQRRRWEHGHLAVAFASTAALLQAASTQRSPALAALALDLCVPPLSLWGLAWLAAAAPATALAALGGAATPLSLLALAALLAGGAVAFAWYRFARDLVPLAAWREAPAYWLAKLPSHLDFLRRREDRWRERTTPIRTSGAGATLASRPRTVALGRLRIDGVTQAECIAHVLRELDAGRGGWLLTANLDHLRLCERDPDYLRLCREASLVVADGMPLVWASRLQRTPLPERVAGSDLLGSLCGAAASRGRSVYLLGGAPGAAEAAARVLEGRHPALRLCGIASPEPGFEGDPTALARLHAALRAARPDIVCLGLPKPKQERLIAELRRELPATWFLGVGIGFSLLAGAVRRAPPWMQQRGLEWVHRLVQEPRRLSRRYLVQGVPAGLRLLGAAARRRASPTRSPSARPGD